MDSLNPTVDELQRRFEMLSPAPRIGSSIRAVLTEGNINPDEIISLIRLEPLIAARIMGEANQLSNRRPQGYESIEEAATAVGFQRMYDILGRYADQREVDAYSHSTDAWKRAVTCAVCMQSLAFKHRLDPHTAYSIGLLHSLASAIVEAGTAPDRPSEEDEILFNLNFRLKSFNVSSLCYQLLRSWNIPHAVADPIRFQYAPLDCQTTGKMACLLNLAKWITGVVREVDELPDQALGPDVLVLNLLGEGEQTLWNLVTEVSDNLQRADAILQGKYTAC